ncbi:ABC transporter substrate-binding protein [Enterococcus sp. SMC-9]|uniref:ABC transporter substrate-binding protein n=1 Tax=Enterococcus sp. SMC-9 TaxID=2862343 RepID=UPI001E2CCA70|nr:ABC transporter substrate-binding protein [Enterococcus sp. SMC-9]MCD1025581.1 ABC transporter substrate-binding protein [Enterococcus sp. SMC-9]
MKKIISSFFILIILVSLTACSKSEAKEKDNRTVITYWASMGGADSEAMQKIVYGFNKSQDKYILDAQFITSDYYKKMDLTVANNMVGMPDVMIMHSDKLATYAQRGILSPISDLGESPLLVKDAYSETAWGAGEYDGVHYTVPLDIHGPVLYYNKKLFRDAGLDPESPPLNKEEFLEAARKTTKGDDYGFVMSTDFINEFLVESMVEQHGSSFFDKNNYPNFDTNEMRDVLQFEMDIINKYNITPKDDYDTIGNFLRGNVAMIFNGPWTAPTFENTDLEWGMAEVPQFFNEKLAVTCKSHQFAIPSTLRDTNKKAGVKAFLEYVNQNSMDWSNSGQAPASKAVYESTEFKSKPQNAMANEFKRAVFTPQVDSIGLYSQMLYAQISEIIYGRKTIEEGIFQAQKDAENMYEAEHLD